MNNQSSRGFSLVELLLVLGVISILLVAAFVVYPQVRDREQANKEIANMVAIRANLTSLYASRGGNYGGLRTDVANQAHAFPVRMNGGDYGPGASVVSSWGGVVAVGTGSGPLHRAVPAGSRKYAIRYMNVPAGVCLKLVSGVATSFDQINVGSVPVVTDASGSPLEASLGGLFNPGLAASACTGEANIVFTTKN